MMIEFPFLSRDFKVCLQVDCTLFYVGRGQAKRGEGWVSFDVNPCLIRASHSSVSLDLAIWHDAHEMALMVSSLDLSFFLLISGTDPS